MKHLPLCALFLFCLGSTTALGQNLVPNPHFEDYNSCPSSLSGLAYSPNYFDFPSAKAWVNPLKDASPDYFNACASINSGASTPQNAFGMQQARSGNGYAGIIAWEAKYQGGTQTLDYSEYIQCKLLQPLQAGERYCVTFYVSPSANLAKPFNNVAIDEVGVNFGKTNIAQPTGYTLSLPYHVISPSGQYIGDTNSWKRIEGIYIASGGEEWLTIGRFKQANNPNSQPIYPAIPDPQNNTRAYLYIDDVSVVKLKASDTTYATHDSSYCVQDQLPMVLKSQGVAGEYVWSNGATSSSITINSSGQYWCRAYANCHVYIDTFNVQYRHPEKLSLGNQIVNCNNVPVTIKTSLKFDNYLWSNGATSEKIVVTESGVYTLTATNRCGTQTDSVHVFIQPPTPQPLADDTTVCQFSQPVLNVKGQNIQWYANAAGVIGSTQQPPVITQKTGYYDLYVTQTIGMCESPKRKVRINVKYQPHEELDDDVVMCRNNLQMIGNELPSDVIYKWNTGDIACCITPNREGVYKRSVRNECGQYIDTVHVNLSLCDDCISMANAFTPNGDGQNDVFTPIITCPITEYTMSIYNRWGQLIYRTNDQKAGWRGTHDGVPVNNGTYLYIIEYRAQATRNGKFLKGNVTLLR